MRPFKAFWILMLTISFGPLVKATTGRNGSSTGHPEPSVRGHVMDANTGKPVTGVTVSVTSSKQRTSKEIQSDASGHFNLDQLPPGDLTLMFVKKGYKIFKSDLGALKSGSILRISIDFKPVEDESNEMWMPLLKLLN